MIKDSLETFTDGVRSAWGPLTTERVARSRRVLEGDRFCTAHGRRADVPVPAIFPSVLRDDETFEPTAWMVLLLCTAAAVLGAYVNLAAL